MLGDAPGVGKTGQAIIALDPTWKSILVVCPASVKGQWQQALWDWREIQSDVIGTSKKRDSSARVVIINYDLMIRDAVLAHLLPREWDLIIFDEAHKLKSITAKRTKAALSMKGLRAHTKRMWFLTGTPRKNRVIDLYPILRSCAPEILGQYNSYMKFSYRYCNGYTARFGFDNSGASHTEELAERLKGFMLRREKRDVLTELPPRVVTVVPLDCTPQVRQIIKEVEWQTTEQAGENDPGLFKLGEIVRMRGALAKYKVPICADYIRDLLEEEDKIVVFYHHKEVLRELQRAFDKVGSVFIDGSVAPAKRSGVIQAFNTDKSVSLFFGQMEACGEGVDGLQNASSCAVFVEPSWSDTDIEQCIGRLERDGQRNDINVHILTIKETLEARMMEVVAEKLKVDGKLYDQKTKTNKEKEHMAKENPVVEQSETEKAAVKLVVAFADFIRTLQGKPMIAEGKAAPASATEDVPPPVLTAKKKPAPAVVTPAPEEDVTEEAIRTRCGDISALKADGTGKAKCIEIIKKIGGGKIADLKTPKMRINCLAALDKAYDELSSL